MPQQEQIGLGVVESLLHNHQVRLELPHERPDPTTRYLPPPECEPRRWDVSGPRAAAEISASGHAGRCAISSDSQLHIMLRERNIEPVIERDSIGGNPRVDHQQLGGHAVITVSWRCLMAAMTNRGVPHRWGA